MEFRNVCSVAGHAPDPAVSQTVPSALVSNVTPAVPIPTLGTSRTESKNAMSPTTASTGLAAGNGMSDGGREILCR